MTDAAYELDYALSNLRDAIDYAEQTGDFVAARKWVNEVEKSAKDNRPDGILLNYKNLASLAKEYTKERPFSLISFMQIDFLEWLKRREEVKSLIDPNTGVVDPPPGVESPEGSS